MNRISFSPAFCFAALLAWSAALLSCEKGGDLATKLEEAINRTPPTVSGIPQPDPSRLLADEPDLVIPPPPEPAGQESAVNKEARVSILGYHDFTTGKSSNDMIINIDDFRAQMQAIRDAKLPVISMSEFLAWRRGEADIPPESILITIDDGWKATHTLALPVLREFGHPFTIFLYQKYVGVGGRSLSHDEIKELMASGADVGSHSVSHQNMGSRSGRGAEAHTAWLRSELEDSWNFLHEHFGAHGKVLRSFAYPFGIYSQEAMALAEEFGYEACFTVNGRKTTWKDPAMQIGRYVVHGRTLANFDAALDFGGSGATSASRGLLAERTDEAGEARGPLVSTWPTSGQVILDRLPEIQMDVSQLAGVDPKSITMRVSGLGRVAHSWDGDTGLIRYQLPQPIRSETCTVQVSLKHAGKRDWETISWQFQIDQLASYLPPESLEKLRQRRADEEAISETAEAQPETASR